ncbi:MAG: Uncharacterised protein [SAR116 cluster bacterium]|nr:MAG: Uncharacterised protein [SAR116 cluster bacterium]
MRNLYLLLLFVFLTACSSEESCTPILCKNGGESIDCECSCPEGFIGADCSIALTPSALVISRIELLKFPTTNGGLPWDPTLNATTSRPDVYVRFEDLSGSTIYEGNTYFENADYTSGALVFTPNNPIEIPIGNGQEYVRFLIYDYDTGTADDLMGAFRFLKFSEEVKIPIMYKIRSSDIDVDFYVSFKW